MTNEHTASARKWAAFPVVLLIRAYQKVLSPMLGKNCRFQPTCSSYAVQALERFGLIRGSWLAIKRIGRCNPLVPAGYDPVPSIVER